MDETTEQAIKQIRSDVREIKRDMKPMILDVDRLKTRQRFTSRVLWLFFTTTVGAIATAVGTVLAK